MSFSFVLRKRGFVDVIGVSVKEARFLFVLFFDVVVVSFKEERFC